MGKEAQEQLRKEYDDHIEKVDPTFKSRHGVATTPVEVVDFVNSGIESILKREFGTSLKNEGVKVLDPFAGTGIFMKRMIEEHIPEDKLKEKVSRGELKSIELNKEAAEIAQENLGDIPVICTDTFTMGDEVWT